MDYSQRLVINTSVADWTPSPFEGVDYRILDEETYLARLQTGASVSYPCAFEVLVLGGTLSDEKNSFAAGSYLRRSSTTDTTFFSKDGCILFVKTHPFLPHDQAQVLINTHETSGWRPGYGHLEVYPLHSFQTQGTALVKWPEGERFVAHTHFGGEEILVLSGTFKDQFGEYPAGTWIRSPHLSSHFPFVDEETVIFVKTGHLL
jgi:anti-sigma factor ChrR (cupin superfamily)